MFNQAIGHEDMPTRLKSICPRNSRIG